MECKHKVKGHLDMYVVILSYINILCNAIITLSLHASSDVLRQPPL